MNLNKTNDWKEKQNILPKNIGEDPTFLKWVEEAQKEINAVFWIDTNIWKKNQIYYEENLNRFWKENPITKIMDDIETYYNDLWMKNGEKKKIQYIIIELGQNAIKHWIKELPASINIYENKENNSSFVCIETTNFIDISDEKKENKFQMFKEKLEESNTLSKDILKEKVMYQMQNWELSEWSNGWLWSRDISRKAKLNDEDRPFEYFFEEKEINSKKIVFAKICCKINLSQSSIADKIWIEKNTEEIAA